MYIDGEDGGGNFIGGAWREDPSSSGLEPLQIVESNHYAMSASSIKETFKDYFSSPAGEVSWQTSMCIILASYVFKVKFT